MADDSLLLWGHTGFGKLGTETCISPFRRVEGRPLLQPLPRVHIVSASRHFSVAVCEDGNVHVWGRNEYMVCGPESKEGHSYLSPQTISYFPNRSLTVKQVSAGLHFIIALTTDQKVFAWGASAQGQTGQGHSLRCQAEPGRLKIESSAKPIQVAAGSNHSLILLEDGTVMGCGLNRFYQALGAPPSCQLHTAQVLTSLKDHFITSVSTHGHTSAALTMSGVVMVWGVCRRAECGAGVAPGTEFSEVTPVLLSLTHPASMISQGTHLGIAYSRDGFLYQWGKGADDKDSSPERMVKGVEGHVVSMAVGTSHALVQTSDGSIYSWGANRHFQTGQPNPSRMVKVQKIKQKGAGAVVAGANFSGTFFPCPLTPTALRNLQDALLTAPYAKTLRDVSINVPGLPKPLHLHSLIVALRCPALLRDGALPLTLDTPPPSSSSDLVKQVYTELHKLATSPSGPDSLTGVFSAIVRFLYSATLYNPVHAYRPSLRALATALNLPSLTAVLDAYEVGAPPEKVHAASLLQLKKDLLRGPELAAEGKGGEVVVLVAEETRIPVHRLILESRCPVARLALSSGLAESRTRVLAVPDISAGALPAFVKFLYAMSPEDISPEHSIELLELAHQWEFAALERAAQEAVGEALDENSVEDLLRYSLERKRSGVTALCIRYLSKSPLVLKRLLASPHDEVRYALRLIDL